MKPLIVLLGLMCLSDVVTAQEAPFTGQVTDEKENSTLNYECNSDGPRLRCNFVQMMVSKKTLLDMSELASQASELAKSSMRPDDCEAYREALAKLKSGADFGTPLGQMEREDASQSFAAVIAFCDEPNAETALAFLQIGQGKDARTCSVSNFRFDLTFDWDFQRKRWESVTPPTGPCGIVVAAFMEPEYTESLPDYAFWNYRQQKVVTNRSGSDPLMGSCAEWPESENKSNWRSRELPLQCDYLKFGF